MIVFKSSRLFLSPCLQLIIVLAFCSYEIMTCMSTATGIMTHLCSHHSHCYMLPAALLHCNVLCEKCDSANAGFGADVKRIKNICTDTNNMIIKLLLYKVHDKIC